MRPTLPAPRAPFVAAAARHAAPAELPTRVNADAWLRRQQFISAERLSPSEAVYLPPHFDPAQPPKVTP